MAAERRFRAMGSDCHLVVVGGAPRLVDEALDRIEQLESRWSRFRPDSEISRLNARAGQPVRVSADTVELVERATVAWRLSGGAFDPTVLGPMLRAGYDRTFAELDGRPAADPSSAAGSGPSGVDGRAALPGCGSWSAPVPDPARLGISAADIRVEGDLVTLPFGIGFDPGGIGKGLAADLVVSELLAAGAAGACVNLGGDVRVAGVGPTTSSGAHQPAAWTVGVWHPRQRLPLVRIGLAGGAVATSTTLLRRWSAPSTHGGAGRPQHHLIDPRSGLPSDTDLELATVVAAEAWVAEVLAKAVILRGSAHPFDTVEATAAQALAVDGEGRVQVTDGLGAYLGDQPVPLLLGQPDPSEGPDQGRLAARPTLAEAS